MNKHFLMNKHVKLTHPFLIHGTEISAKWQSMKEIRMMKEQRRNERPVTSLKTEILVIIVGGGN